MEFALKTGIMIDGAIAYENNKPIIGKKIKVENVITTRSGLVIDEKTLEVKNTFDENDSEKVFELFNITDQKVECTGKIVKGLLVKDAKEDEPVK